jgi:hypothetical protein
MAKTTPSVADGAADSTSIATTFVYVLVVLESVYFFTLYHTDNILKQIIAVATTPAAVVHAMAADSKWTTISH